MDWIGTTEWEPEMKDVMIDFEAAGGIDLDRLERSLELHGIRVGHGRYRITGGSRDHWVDLHTMSTPRCDCGDHLWRERICKHILAALLREGDERVVAALGAVMRRARSRGSSAVGGRRTGASQAATMR